MFFGLKLKPETAVSMDESIFGKVFHYLELSYVMKIDVLANPNIS
jgi:hypothetical protein